MSNQQIIIRLFICLLIGGITGLERERSNQFAGFRTHILVAIGSGITSIIAVQLFTRYSMYSNMDPARLPAQVLSGIGFLGAGAILKNSSGIRGLTTAAGIWATSSICIAIGYGEYVLGITAWLIVMSALYILKSIDKVLFKNRTCSLYVTMSNLEAIKQVFIILKECKMNIKDFKVDSKGYLLWTASYSVSFDRRLALEEVEIMIREVSGILDVNFYI